VQYLYKILTLAYRKIHTLDEDIMNLWPNLADEREVKMGPYKENGYLIYRAPGSRLIVGKDIELFYVGTEKFFIICLVADNRVSFWKMLDILEDKPFSTFFNYEEFMYWPKYKTLAHLIYNMYHNIDNSSHKSIVDKQPWKLFKSHMVFSPDCVLGDTGNTNLCTVKLCCSMYGDYDDEELTTDILWDQKPWNADTCSKANILTKQTRVIKRGWNIIKGFVYAGGDIIRTEEFLCSLKNPFIDEGYKFIEIALNMDNLALYNWAINKYDLDKKRLAQWLDLFHSNSVSRKIRGLN